ncbi:MAG: TetR family transcriptional regulator C-terminal domain-containing protein [Anaerolineales bacterium]|nr:TetR family transcriptional regulator C-terminal domain-containing protein [Rhodocyclaceae bacterium]MCW5886699.1 TetR family transcriptional regulator C-terminal domain-containing protein [Anaerolineales bacterium]
MASQPKAPKKTTGRRDELLRIGVATLTEKGFHNTSIDELALAAGVPKGSFAYYFGSKDAYTVEVIETYGQYFVKKLDRILTNQEFKPLDRLKVFADEAAHGMEKYSFRRGCLVGSLAQELGALDDRIRSVLLETLQTWQGRIRTCLDEAKAAGDLLPDADTPELARLFWYTWEGAVLAAKLERSRAPLDIVSEAFQRQLVSPASNKG